MNLQSMRPISIHPVRALSAATAGLALALVAILLAPRPVSADLDKDDIEKKEQEAAKPALGNDEGDLQQRVAKKGEENLREINRLLDEVKNDLANKNTGSGTQKKQRRAVSQLEELIQEIAKACQKSSSSSSNSDSNSQPQQPKPNEGQQPKPQQTRKDKEKQDAQQMQKQKEQEKNDELNRNDQRRDKLPPSSKNKLSPVERLRMASRLGMLPAKMTQALSASEKEAPARYRAVVDRYYKKLSDYHDKKR